jgi:hypothetical protein
MNYSKSPMVVVGPACFAQEEAGSEIEVRHVRRRDVVLITQLTYL